ncbi:ribosomal protein S21/MRP21 [Haloterrigena sp. H1]|uniref:bS21 family ribosomal protein n=1 Tax=Haloterrigena sp. H1 TaxID=2552943 RepID=UPI00110D925E|nr:bS21 family ribosomal protein [Haloterrigena sp. H1]TMT85391.1 ribosomal protein S21/MRP21 [Haloterrigena sp. H1]
MANAFGAIFMIIGLLWIGATFGVAWDAYKHNRSPVTWFFAVAVFGIFGLLAYSLTYSEGINMNSKRSSDTNLRVSANAIKEETGEETELSLVVHTESVDTAIKQFERRCRNEGYLIQEKPSVERE